MLKWLPFQKESHLEPVAYLSNGILPRMRFVPAEQEFPRLALIPLMGRDTVEFMPLIETEEPLVPDDKNQEIPEMKDQEEIPDPEVEAARQREEEITPENLLLLFKKQVEAGSDVEMPFVLPSEGDLVDPNNIQRIRSRYRLER